MTGGLGRGQHVGRGQSTASIAPQGVSGDPLSDRPSSITSASRVALTP